MRHFAILLPLVVGLTACADDDVAPPRGDSLRIVGDTNGGGGDGSSGDPLVGDPLAGDPLVGDPLAGDPLAGDPLAGDSDACHSHDFGGDVVNILQVASLPAMTGGSITLGSYDVVEAQTSGTLTGATIRSTWVFETNSIMQIIEQITVSGTPPEPTPRTLTWLTNGTGLQRQQVCGGDRAFDNQYSVRTTVSGTFLDIRQNTLLFTYQLRE